MAKKDCLPLTLSDCDEIRLMDCDTWRTALTGICTIADATCLPVLVKLSFTAPVLSTKDCTCLIETDGSGRVSIFLSCGIAAEYRDFTMGCLRVRPPAQTDRLYNMPVTVSNRQIDCDLMRRLKKAINRGFGAKSVECSNFRQPLTPNNVVNTGNFLKKLLCLELGRTFSFECSAADNKLIYLVYCS
ncbi:MAG: hypothetical protein KGO82_18975 [Bacteroidota bacterium]|nr:hypothetical protein [Bacteroidota bacterium]